MRVIQLVRSPIPVLLAVLLAGTSTGFAATTAENAEFQKLDTNRDGYISREEARKVEGFDKALIEADGDRDDRLNPDEFIKAQSVHERMRAGQYVSDSVVTAKVKAALVKDLHLKGFDISVETFHGTVQLSGFVDNKEQVARAGEIAASVQGVGTVKNSLIVKG